MIIADFSMVPIGSGTSAAKYIRAVYDLLKEPNMKFLPGPMSIIGKDQSFEELFDPIEKANQRLEEMGVRGIITSVYMDHRLDKEISIESKLRAIGK